LASVKYSSLLGLQRYRAFELESMVSPISQEIVVRGWSRGAFVLEGASFVGNGSKPSACGCRFLAQMKPLPGILQRSFESNPFECTLYCMDWLNGFVEKETDT